jgi:hypothetical protein
MKQKKWGGINCFKNEKLDSLNKAVKVRRPFGG